MGGTNTKTKKSSKKQPELLESVVLKPTTPKRETGTPQLLGELCKIVPYPYAPVAKVTQEVVAQNNEQLKKQILEEYGKLGSILGVFSRFPEEIVESIFDYVGTLDLFKSMGTSKLWQFCLNCKQSYVCLFFSFLRISTSHLHLSPFTSPLHFFFHLSDPNLVEEAMPGLSLLLPVSFASFGLDGILPSVS